MGQLYCVALYEQHSLEAAILVPYVIDWLCLGDKAMVISLFAVGILAACTLRIPCRSGQGQSTSPSRAAPFRPCSIRAALQSAVAAVPRQPPSIRYVSNVTGQWIRTTEAVDPEYWARHSCQTVRFAEGLDVLLAEPDFVLLEVGPGQSLSAFARQHPGENGERTIVPTLRTRYEAAGDREYMLNTLGKLWVLGLQPLWRAVHEGEDPGRVSLPGYAFDRRRYLLPPVPSSLESDGIIPQMLLS